MNSKIWLSSPHLSGNEMKYIKDAFDKNWVTTMGENVDEFEKAIQQALKSDQPVVALNSCTSALHLALVQCGVGHGDEVICQSMTFSASANPIIYQGATPIFVDSEIETWGICPIFLEETIEDRLKKGKKPKAIIAVHLYGMPYKVDEINLISKKYDIPIIEDAAESFGSTYKGRAVGTFGRFSALSFNGNKIITTSAGGALICQRQEEKDKTIFLASQAKDKTLHYQHSEIGYNYRMSNISAGIGRAQIEILDDRVKVRRALHKFYQQLFSPIDGIRVFTEPSSDFFSNHWLNAILIDPIVTNKTKDDLHSALLKDNIESRPLWKPMHLQPIFERYPYYGGNVSENLFKKGLCLPSGSNLTELDKSRIKNIIKNEFIV